MVKCREDEQGEEACERDGRDDLLQRGLLGIRAGLLAPLDERRVFDGEVDPEDADRDHEDHNKDPGLPVVERSGREEEQQPQQEGAADECGECLKEEFAHAIRFLSMYSFANALPRVRSLSFAPSEANTSQTLY